MSYESAYTQGDCNTQYDILQVQYNYRELWCVSIVINGLHIKQELSFTNHSFTL
jgi:hypothetical protein